MNIKRDIQDDILKRLFKKKAIIIYGARRVGKTTLVKEIQNNFSDISLYLNCDEPDIKEALTNKTSTELKSFIGPKKLIIIDEAQRVINIGLTLKLIVDNYPEIQIIATGSSSFELSNQTVEPLTGRKYEYILFPFSFHELKSIYTNLELDRLLEKRIVFGMYPEIIINEPENERNLKEITGSYLYKDVLQYQNIRNPDVLDKLLRALALQVGSEVSYNELANLLTVDKKTIQSYISLLEKAFVIFRLQPFNKNLRNEIKKLRKIYFIDNGIRNALINNLNPLALRNDTGILWENFLISERIKYNFNNFLNINAYFWRTHQKEGIDYIEEKTGNIQAYEFKWKNKNSLKSKPPKAFSDKYNKYYFETIDKKTYQNFLNLSF